MSARPDGIVGAFALALTCIVCGCAHVARPGFPATTSAGVELTQTPFFPQQLHECGPAALATALGASGVDVAPADLVPQTYLPGRKGSLQLELIAAARRHHRIAYVLAPEPAVLIAELDAGHPVVVLQDLGVGPLHVWHYAVVIGYRADEQQIVLRSGTSERLVMAYDDFLRSWRGGGYWGLVVLDSETAAGDGRRNDLCRVHRTARGARRYRNRARRLRDCAHALARQRRCAVRPRQHRTQTRSPSAAAEQTYRRLLELSPDNAIVLNNLAEVLLDRGCAAAALAYADAALERVPAGSDVEAAVRDTRAQAAAARVENPDPSRCSGR